MCFKRLSCMLLAAAMIVGFVPKIDAQATTILPLEEFEEEITEEPFEEAEQDDFSETVVEEEQPDMVIEGAEIQATTPSSVTEAQVIERMKTVKAMEGKYFTVDGKSCGKESDHGCSNCLTTNLIKSSSAVSGYLSLLPESINRLPNGTSYSRNCMSCRAFVLIVHWYLYAQKSTDTVEVSAVSGLSNVNLSNSNMLDSNGDPVFRIGDIVETSSHSQIIMDYYKNSSGKVTGFKLIDCNSNGTSVGNCKVQTWTYTTFSSFNSSGVGGKTTIYRATNYKEDGCDYNSNGYCNDCGQDYLETNTYKNSITTLNGTVTPSTYSVVRIKPRPYEASTWSSGESYIEVDSATVNYSCVNHSGNTWYQVTFKEEGSSTEKVGYTYSKANTFTAAANTVKASCTVPNYIYKGTSLWAKDGDYSAKVYSSNGTTKLSKVVFGIYKPDGTLTASENQVTKTSVNATSYSVTSSDDTIQFSGLAIGNYTFKITGYDVNGESGSASYEFVVIKSGTTMKTVTYNANGGSGAPSAQKKADDAALTLRTGKPTRSGYTFKGWATSSTATTAQYQPGGSYTANSSVTLYAVWEANTYTVTYNANGGSGAPASQTKVYGTPLTLSTVQPTRSGYQFLGWATSSTATTAQYQPGGSYTANSSVTLYAVWESNSSAVVASGYCGGEGDGTNLEWKLTADGTLTISGSGAMKDYPEEDATEWRTESLKPQLKKLVLEEGITRIGDQAFVGCSGFTGELLIPDSVTEIGWQAFDSCSGFTGELVIPSKVKNIGWKTFCNCSGFTGNLTIPDSVTFIGPFAFRGCSGFDGKLVLSKNVTEILDGAFLECSGLTGDLIIPDSVTTIKGSTFENCSGFTGDLVIPNSVTIIEIGAFENCSGFDGKLSLSDNLTEIGEDAFADCSGFTGKLVIPAGVTTIGSYAFWRCSGFTGELVIPDSVTSIGEWAFNGCSSFTGSLVIPDGVTSIDKGTFRKCSGITEATIPSSVTSIGAQAFDGCEKLTKIYFKGATPADVVEATSDSRSFPTTVTLYYIEGQEGWTSPTWKGYNTATYNTEADENAPTIEVQGTTGMAGDEVTVTISLKNNPGIASMKLNVQYDADVLEIVSANIAPEFKNLSGANAIENINRNPLILNWTLLGDGNATADTFATITFKIKEDAAEGAKGNITVTYDEDDVYNSKEENISFAVVNSYVEVTSYIPGDINGDGKVNNKDVTRLFQYLSGMDVEVEKRALDVNGDGKINNKDVTRLFQYLSGMDVEIK